MTHKQHRSSALRHLAHLAQALLLELRVADGEHLVHDQDLRVQVGGHGEGEAHVHAAGVALHGGVQELFHAGEVHDGVELTLDLLALHAQDGAVQVDVLAAGQLRVEAGADLQEASHATIHDDLAGGGLGDAGEDLEQGGFARAVSPDNAHHVALLHVEGDVLQRPDSLPLPAAQGVAQSVHDRLGEHGVPLGVMLYGVGLGYVPNGYGNVFVHFLFFHRRDAETLRVFFNYVSPQRRGDR